MNIKILDSWLREYLKTKATPQTIAEKLSLTSVSVERVEPYGKGDFTYDIEVTTNRVDLMSVVGLARESVAVLSQFKIPATFIPLTYKKHTSTDNLPMEIENDPMLVNRICAAILSVEQKESPQFIKDRLESAGIRSLNNLVDITNYCMLELGHPTHVFDYDRLTTKKLIIRQAKHGEKIKTLDEKEHILLGGDIVADDGTGTIIDLLGVMGTANTVVTKNTKRILFFLDNNKPDLIRKTSMNLAIRTDAAALNEKGVDPSIAIEALFRGIDLYYKYAQGRLLLKPIDIYPNKPKPKQIFVSEEKISAVLGVPISLKTSSDILKKLGFSTKIIGKRLDVIIPSQRLHDMDIAQDLIEEIARIYGYHNLPSIIPSFVTSEIYRRENDEFYWENRIKNALKYWGFIETYTYSMVSENLYEGPISEAVTIDNPLSEDWMYMRKTLIPSLLQVAREHKERKELKLFEIANVYEKKENELPKETRMIAAVIKENNNAFYKIKGVLEQLFIELGIKNVSYSKREAGLGADIHIDKEYIGEIEILEEHFVDFEINFEVLLKHATRRKIYTPIPKYPPILEDLAFVVDEHISTSDIIREIKKQSKLIKSIELLDIYENTRTFHIVYQDPGKNLTDVEASKVREKIITALKETVNAKLKQ